MEIKIKCPTCGKILRLEDNPKINTAQFTCPVCKTKHVVGECVRIVDKPKPTIESEETQYSGSNISSNNTEETKYQPESNEKVGTLVDAKGHSYKLSLGINTVGRKATTSEAMVQIDTDDRTMSRTHAIVEVMSTQGQMIHILKNGGNKNPSYHNGKLIDAADQLILNDGDKVIFGKTELIFKKQ